MLRKSRSSPLLPPPYPQSFPRHPSSLDSCVGLLSDQLSKLGPLEDTFQPCQSSTYCSLTPPHPLQSSSSLPAPSSSSSSSFDGPCETDESRGFSQYDLRSQYSGSAGNQFRSNGTSSGSQSQSSRDQCHIPSAPTESQFSQPTEDQYDQHPQTRSTNDSSGLEARIGSSSGPQQEPEPGPESTGSRTSGLHTPECLSPPGPLQSLSLETSGDVTHI